uniref:ABC-type glutathione-S-conjugate transporter n=1 Tax=Diaphorina citri TaxID=121845 RepID=A0A3R5WTB4_DIACI|nr:ATP-binding cassette sub-family C member 1 [Diaphorina citri]
MDEFCGTKFWDQNLTWNTNEPELTPCFESTVLVWTPCLFLWVFSPLEAYYLVNSKFRDIPWNLLNRSKLFFTLVLLIISLSDTIYGLFIGEGYAVTYTSPVIKFVTFLLLGALILLNRTRGLRTSGCIFLFVSLLALCGAPQYRTELTASLTRGFTIDYSFVSYMVYYPCVISLLILNFFADAAPTFSEYPVTENPSPEYRASFPSKLIFAWFDRMAWLGYRKPLENKDLWNLNHEDTSKEIVPLFDKHWNESLRKAARSQQTTPGTQAAYLKNSSNIDIAANGSTRPPQDTSKKPPAQASIVGALCKTFGPTFLFGSSLKLIQDLLTFVSPQILSWLIEFVNEPNAPLWKGYFYAILLLVTSVVQTLLLSTYFDRMFRVGMRMRSALISTIYRKALTISNNARKETTVGEIVNLMSVDAQRMDITPYLNMLWSAPLQIGLALYFLWGILGPSVLAGLAVMVILIPVNGYVATRIRNLQIKQMKSKDARVKLMNEVLSGIKVLKLYAWELSFQEQILKIRSKEIKVLKEAAYLNAATSFIWSCAPFLVSLVSFAVYLLSDDSHVLDAQIAFVSLSLFNILRFPLSMLPMLISQLVQASVSVKRINSFMNQEDLDPNAVTHDPDEKDPLVIENGTFTWERNTEGEGAESPPTLQNINMRVREGTLVAIVGSVGAGKSSLVSALCGEMDKISGRVNTKGSIAFVPQQAWIQNATLRDNIVFGKTHVPRRYNKVIDACALTPDFEMLPAGDSTEIGEKGINLSGGQKQRVSLARAVYNDADMYFLDDPLSAVDSHVGKHIFDNVIGPKGILKNKTRVLVTHGITYLPEVDQIIVLKNGQVSESGNYQELLAKKGDFAEFLISHIQEERAEDEEVSKVTQDLLELDPQLGETLQRQRSQSASQRSHHSETGSIRSRTRSGSDVKPKDVTDPKIIMDGKLTDTEKAETGSVKWQVYLHYLKSIGLPLSMAAILLNIAFQGFAIGSNIWLSVWSEDKSTIVNGTQDVGKRDLYLGVYGALGLGQVIWMLVCVVVAKGTIRAARRLHLMVLTNILHSCMSFFDTTPLGRILSRCGKDVDTVDNILPNLLLTGVYSSFTVLATIFVICYSTPVFIFVIVPVSVLYFFIQRFYVATSRQLKRLESVSRSPIYSHFGETVTGAQTIRAYGVEERFIKESEIRVDFNQVSYFPSVISNRWLAVRLETVGNLITFSAALLAVLSKETLNAGLVGLSVSYAMQITQTLNWLVRMTSDVETNIVAVERIKEYGETPQEAEWVNDKKPKDEWPEKGEVEFKDYKVRYREGLELVLRGLNFKVNGGEKVGIVGRTGAGKSSLTLALFRIIEPADGTIIIDGVDIRTLGLHTLRSRLTIIPQDPVLFSGTLRLNLDPVGESSDEAIWKALELAHLNTFVSNLPARLQHEVSEGGENLSVGQRQLICLARALLRKTKILILDEATAAVDLETDDLIQSTIRSEFAHCTVLTIAHRLNTIIDSDRVLVLDKGLVVEFDSPSVLMKNKASIFYSMAKDAGLAS